MRLIRCLLSRDRGDTGTSARRQIRTLSRSARQSHGDVGARPERPVPTSFSATGTRRPVLASTSAREPMGCLRLTVTRSLHAAAVLPAGAAALSAIRTSLADSETVAL